jgi:hypothetical protein
MKSGFKVLDSDLHTMEPDGLWERYLDEPFKKFAPRFTRREDNAPNQPVIVVGDLEIAEFSKRPSTSLVGAHDGWMSRRANHSRFARWLETKAGDGVEEVGFLEERASGPAIFLNGFADAGEAVIQRTDRT